MLTIHDVEGFIARRRQEAVIHQAQFPRDDPMRLYWKGVEDQLKKLEDEIDTAIERSIS